MFSYIHIPFCESKCKYCRFASFWWIQDLKVKKYVKFLINEIKSFNTYYISQESIYFWWWTPSILSISQLQTILDLFEKKGKDTEITLETTPKNITLENIIWWKSIWINRLSIWVQSLNDKTLKEIWRGQKWDIICALDNIKQIWFENVSLDFIIWLPYVNNWELKKNIEFLLDNYDFIKHISVYMLEDYYDADSEKDTNFEKVTYPKDWSVLWIKEEDFLWEYIEIKSFLEERWFNRYEISNFSKPWFECRHNKAYWDHSEISWFWLWASYFLNKTRYTNSDNFSDYYTNNNKFSEKLTSRELFLESIMFGLRTTGIKKENYKLLNQEKIQEFIENWFLKYEESFLKLNDKWIVFLDYILREI